MADNFGLKIGIDGEKEFKKALSDINSSFKVLGSEMKLVDSEFDKNDRSVKALTSRNEVLNKEIEAQKQKIDTLKSALDNATTSFGETDKRTQNWQTQLNNAQAELNKMEQELEENNSALGRFGDKFDTIGEKLKTVGAAAGAAIAAIGTAAVAAGKQIFDMATQTASAGDEIDKTSQKLGMSAEAYQEWDYVLGQSGVEITSMTTGLKTLTNQIDNAKNGSSQAAERFEALGISMDDLSTMSREDVFSAVISGMQGMADSTERAALANDLFGKSGQELTPLFNETAESTEALKQTAHDLGFIMSDEAVAASADFNDALDTLQRTIGGVKNSMIGEMLPGITMIMTGFTDLVAGNKQAGEELKLGVTTVVNTITQMIPQAVGVLSLLAEAILESAPSIISALAEGIISAIPTLMPVVIEIINELVTVLAELLPQIVGAGIDILVSLINGITQALPTLVAAVPQIVISIVNTLIANIDKIITAGVELLVALIQNLPQIIVEVAKAAPQIITGLVNAFTQSMSRIVEVGANIVKGLWQGIQSLAGWLWDKVSSWISSIWDGICDFFGIHSPSREMAWVGEMLVKGLAQSIDDNGDEAVKAAEEMSKDIDNVMTALAKDMQVGLPSMNFQEAQMQTAGGLVNGIVSGLSSVMGGQSAGAQPIVLQIKLDSKTIAQTIFDPLRDVSRQRGVSLG